MTAAGRIRNALAPLREMIEYPATLHRLKADADAMP